jgi:putative transposase
MYHWATAQHHHSGLNGYTPEQVLSGEYRHVAVTKQAALDSRYAQNPERFVGGRPIVKRPPSEVAINPVSDEDIAEGIIDAVNFPTLPKASI